MNKSKIAAAFLIALLCAGCATGKSGPTPPFQVSTLPGKQRFLSSDAVQVSINEKEYTRLDDNREFGKTTKNFWATGALWKQAFIGDPTGNAAFEIKSTVVEIASHVPGFSFRITYIIDGELTYNGKKFPVHAEGTRAGIIPTGGLLRGVIENGIKNAAEQSRSIIESQRL